MLDVHPPHHPTHTWKDFFIHIATISVGLLIAIGLEQTVELIHHRHQLQKAREELRDEIDSNRRATAIQLDCVHKVQAELQADMAILLAHRANDQPLTGKLNFDWSFRKTRSAAYTLNKQSGALDPMPHPELVRYDYAFSVAQSVMEFAAAWETDLGIAKAIATRSPEGTLSPQDTNELITAISNTQGALDHTERLITFEQGALSDPLFDR
jgi:hypothetical protein